MKGKDTRGYPYQGYLPTARPDHNTANSVPYSFRVVCGFFYVPQNCEQWRVARWGPTVYHSHQRRLESLNICRCNYNGIGSLYTQLFKDPGWSGHSLNHPPHASYSDTQPSDLTGRRSTLILCCIDVSFLKAHTSTVCIKIRSNSPNQ